MLTIMAFMNMVGKSLPPISYLSWIHYYTVGTFFFVFGALVEGIVLHSFFKQQQAQAAAPAEEKKGLLGSLGIELEDNFIVKLDEVLRWICPAAFVLFNIIMFCIEIPQINF